MGPEHFGRAAGQRRIEEDLRALQLPAALQLRDILQDFLRTLDREDRHDDIAAGGQGGLQFAAQDGPAAGLGDGLARTIAVGRLDQRHIGTPRPRGIGLQGLVERPEIAGENEPQRARCGVDFDLDEGAAENVAGIAHAGPHAGQRLEPAIVGLRVDEGERRLGVRPRVDRHDLGLGPAGVAAVQALDVVFLDGARVGQQPAKQVARRFGGERPALEACEGQLGKQAAVVDMGMREQNGGDLRRRERKGPIVQGTQRLRSLEHAAVDEKRAPRRHQPVAGSRDGAGGTMDVQRQGHARRPIVMPSSAAASWVAKRKSASKAAWIL